jgi:hypothetical protein
MSRWASFRDNMLSGRSINKFSKYWMNWSTGLGRAATPRLRHTGSITSAARSGRLPDCRAEEWPASYPLRA